MRRVQGLLYLLRVHRLTYVLSVSMEKWIHTRDVTDKAENSVDTLIYHEEHITRTKNMKEVEGKRT